MAKDKGMGHMYLIKFTGMRANGETILLLGKENYSEMENYFSKEAFKMD